MFLKFQQVKELKIRRKKPVKREIKIKNKKVEIIGHSLITLIIRSDAFSARIGRGAIFSTAPLLSRYLIPFEPLIVG